MTASSLRRFTTLAVGFFCLVLGSCKSTKKSGDYSGVVDYTTPDTNLSQEEYPFDEKGNYLADVVSGKKRGSKNKKIDPPKSYTETYEKPPEPVVAATPTPTPNYETPPTSDPYAPVYSSGSTSSTAYQPKPTSSSGSSKTKSTASSSKPKPKPKVVAKTKPKPKPKSKSQTSSVSHTIRKGDTLYSLANRYGTSVAAIKRASGLSSDTLRDGRTLKIPRK